MEDALKSGIQEVAIFAACSETFSKKNINCSIAESFIRFRQVLAMAKYHKIKVRGYLSTAFGCPYEGRVSESRVVRLVRALFKMGVYEVSVGDTIGVATPKQVVSLIKKIKKVAPLRNIAMHFHDTRGTALANVYASYELGVRAFDSSVGGLGGCPYAKGATGNLATEDLVYMLKGMGVPLNVDLEKLIQIRKWMEEKVERELPARTKVSFNIFL
jgi:hydroxymethylglutaryl-CoA lyase